MEQLKSDWLTDGLIDFEYKKYILLAYLKDIRKRFDHSQLYPFLGELVFHYNNLKKVMESKEVYYEKFPKAITRADFDKLKFNYTKIVKDDVVMMEIENIITYAIPLMNSAIKEGREIHDFVEENLELTPVGVTPIYEDEGYLMIKKDKKREVAIYRYQLSVFESAKEKYRGIATDFVNQEQVGFGRTFENIKISLAKRFTYLPNPATYLFVSKFDFPLPETLLPVAKRLLVRHITPSDA
ncbi:MAG: hypothetical protein KI790_03990 [Cyclobacteriaceae bacterium]|nr:hypothetical protein [Cyclobacteriaceae bacterium HetDA_MAG_MS6]